jgi:heat shock protein HslJ
MIRMTRPRWSRVTPALAALAVAFAVTACGSSSATASPAPTPAGPLTLAGTGWLLISYLSPDGTSYTVPSAVTPNIVFDATTASGKGGCNTFNAPYTLTGDNIKIGTLAGTKAFCEEPMGTVENVYFAALEAVNKAAMLDNGRLQLWDSTGKTTLQFVPAS